MCSVCSHSCRAQCVISKPRFVQQAAGVTLSGRGVQGACVAAAPRQLPGRLWPRWLLEPCRVGSGNKLLSSGCRSLWEREVGDGSYCAFGPAELCGMLVVDSVTFSVPCLPVFLYLLHLPLCQNAAIAKKKKTKKKFLLFSCLSL